MFSFVIGIHVFIGVGVEVEEVVVDVEEVEEVVGEAVVEEKANSKEEAEGEA